MIKWTDFALFGDFGALLDVSDVVPSNDIIHDGRCDVACSDRAHRCIKEDAVDGMRIQETESVNSPARMVGTSGSDDLKIFPTGRRLESEGSGNRCDVRTGGGA